MAVEDRLVSKGAQVERMEAALDGSVRALFKKLKVLAQQQSELRTRLVQSDQQLVAKENLVESFKKYDMLYHGLFIIKT